MKFLLFLVLFVAAIALPARAMTVGEYLAVQHSEAVRCAAAYPALQEQFLVRAQNIELIAAQLRGQLGATYQGNDLAEFLAIFGGAPAPAVIPLPVLEPIAEQQSSAAVVTKSVKTGAASTPRKLSPKTPTRR